MIVTTPPIDQTLCVPPANPRDVLVRHALAAAARRTGVPLELLLSPSGVPGGEVLGVQDVVATLKKCDSIRVLVAAAYRELFTRIRMNEERSLLYAAAEAISVSEETAEGALLKTLWSNADPVTVVRALHTRDDMRVLSQHLTALLGIKDEKVGGELEKHSTDQQKIFDARGGYMYQASDAYAIRSVFSKVHFRTGSSFYDLGSGYGHVVFYGAIVRPDLTFKGIELMSERIAECERVKNRLGITNLSFEAADVAQADISHADVLFLFNPFPPDVRVEVSRKINQRAREKPLMVIDYGGMVTQDAPELIPVSDHSLDNYRVAISRRFKKEALEIAMIEGPSPRRLKKGGSR